MKTKKYKEVEEFYTFYDLPDGIQSRLIDEFKNKISEDIMSMGINFNHDNPKKHTRDSYIADRLSILKETGYYVYIQMNFYRVEKV